MKTLKIDLTTLGKLSRLNDYQNASGFAQDLADSVGSVEVLYNRGLTHTFHAHPIVVQDLDIELQLLMSAEMGDPDALTEPVDRPNRIAKTFNAVRGAFGSMWNA